MLRFTLYAFVTFFTKFALLWALEIWSCPFYFVSLYSKTKTTAPVQGNGCNDKGKKSRNLSLIPPLPRFRRIDCVFTPHDSAILKRAWLLLLLFGYWLRLCASRLGNPQTSLVIALAARLLTASLRLTTRQSSSELDYCSCCSAYSISPSTTHRRSSGLKSPIWSLRACCAKCSAMASMSMSM